MKMSFVSLSVASLSLLFFCTACNKQKGETTYIPGSAAVVVGFNLPQLESKLDTNAIKKSSLYQQMLTQTTDSSFRNIFLHPSTMGIDLTADIYGFLERDKHFGKGYLGLVAGLSDRGKLEGFLKAHYPSMAVRSSGDLGHMNINGNEMIGWNNHVVMVFRKISSGNENPGQDLDTGKTMTFLKVFQQLNSQSTSASVTGISQFSSPEQTGDDISFFLNVAQVYQVMAGYGKNPLLSMIVKPDLYDGCYGWAGLVFGKSSIRVKTKYYLNDRMGNAARKLLSGRPVDRALLERIPTDSPLAVMAISINPSGIKNYLNDLNLEGLADAALSQKGNSGLDTTLKAFQGGLILAVTHVGRQISSMSPADTSTMGKIEQAYSALGWLAVLTVGDTSSMDKLLSQVATMGMLVRDGPMSYHISLGHSGMSMGFASNSRMIVLGSSQDLVNQYVSGSASGPKQVLDPLYGNPLGFYLDIHGLSTTMAAADSSKGKRKHMPGWLFNNLYVTGGGLSGNTESGTLTLSMMNHRQNSLMQLVNTAIRSHDREMKRKQSRMGTDSTQNSNR